MIITVKDWILDADISSTMELSASQAKDHCSCGYCRNYYSAIDDACPGLRPLLTRFGLDIEGPDELCPYEPTIYEVSYLVQGNIIKKGNSPLYIDGTPLSVKSAAEVDFDTEHPEPHFALNIGLIELPWVLDEPMDEVISPANDPACLERMERKLLERIASDEFYS